MAGMPVLQEQKPVTYVGQSTLSPIRTHKKTRDSNESRVSNLKPGDDLLSHGDTPHYHRRGHVSLLSSGWGQVVPCLYGRQANWLELIQVLLSKRSHRHVQIRR